MNWTTQCAAVIPCLNEGPRIGQVIERVRRHLPRVIVVDDGSSDDTSARARAAGAEVLRHETSLGKGAALRDGWRRAFDQGCEWAMSLDGDGQHDPEEIPVFMACAEGTGALLVVGNRMARTEGMPRLRRWTNRWMSWRLSRWAGQPLPDTQNGFRLMHLPSWSKLRIETTHFEMESEILLAFARARWKIGFVPSRVIYGEEQSKIHPIRDAWRWIRWTRRWRRRQGGFAGPFSRTE